MRNLSSLLRILGISLFIPFLITSCSDPATKSSNDYPINPVPFTAIHLTDHFWAPRLETNHRVTIPIAIEQSIITGRIKNFEIAGGLTEGKFCSTFPFDDSDVFKIIEAASYSLQTNPDNELELVLDSLIYKIAEAQEEDGYLYTIRTIMGDDSHEWIGKRWEKVNELSHELYNLGHLYEAAVAHYQATGKRNLLDVAIKSAELVDSIFGWGKIEDYPGHQEIELALVKLFRVTGEQKYLDKAKFFLDVRGPDGASYNQAHKKVIDQSRGVGHSVRATYMYSAMADIAALYNDASYITAMQRIWEDMVFTKTYITGGIGSTGSGEGFEESYKLPNRTAYCETCASVGNIMWNHRMFLLDGEAKYIDVLERTLYNGFLSGVSLTGDHFFYPNVLESGGQHERREWFGCACCPPNIARLLPSLPGYIYAIDGKTIYVNLFMDNIAKIPMGNNEIELVQKTGYPWQGKVELLVNTMTAQKFELKIRIPGWARNEAIPGNLYYFTDTLDSKISFYINGELVQYEESSGYASLVRKWNKGDVVSFEFPVTPRTVVADERVADDLGKIAVQAGPLVYAAEWPDVPDGRVLDLVFDRDLPLKPVFNDTLLNGVMVIETFARTGRQVPDEEIEPSGKRSLYLIPYYSWNNRGPGEMMVWLPVVPVTLAK